MLDLYLRNLPLTLLCPAGLANLMRKTAEAEDQAASAKALATAAQLTVEASTVIFEAATAHSKALIAAAKKVDEEVNTQVEVDDDKQSNSSDSEVLDEDVGIDIGNVVQSIE